MKRYSVDRPTTFFRWGVKFIHTNWYVSKYARQTFGDKRSLFPSTFDLTHTYVAWFQHFIMHRWDTRGDPRSKPSTFVCILEEPVVFQRLRDEELFFVTSLISMWYNERLNWHIFRTFTFVFILFSSKFNIRQDEKKMSRVKNSSNGNRWKKKRWRKLKTASNLLIPISTIYTFVKEMRHQTDRSIKKKRTKQNLLIVSSIDCSISY